MRLSNRYKPKQNGTEVPSLRAKRHCHDPLRSGWPAPGQSTVVTIVTSIYNRSYCRFMVITKRRGKQRHHWEDACSPTGPFGGAHWSSGQKRWSSP